MAKLQLTFASALYDRMQPIYTGEVPVDGIDLNFIRIEQPRPIFDRMSGGQEFDVAEYSSSEYVQRYANKQCPFGAIPVFPSRCFRHSFIGINKKSGISKPKDLEGKRIGVGLEPWPAAIFIRGILQHDHGVDFSSCTWVQGAINDKGAHGAPVVLPLLKPVKIEQGPANKSLDDLIQEGVIDATIGTAMPESFRTNPDIARLFPDFVERERDHYKRTKIYPIMHLVAIKKSVYEKYPFVATSILAKEDVVDAYGHVSVRNPDNPKHFFLSRSLAPELIEAEDIVELGMDGQPVNKDEKRSLYLERFIHAAIMEANPDVNAV